MGGGTRRSKEEPGGERRTPGVEGEQLGVHQYEGVQHLLPGPLRAAVELLHQAALQELYALFTQRGVDQPLHRLAGGASRVRGEQD